MSQAVAEKLMREFDREVGERSKHEQVWRECFEYTYPLRSQGFGNYELSGTTGQNLQARILDNTATDSCQVSVSGIVGGTTPANARWFGLDVGPETAEGDRRWLDDSADKLWRIIHASNFDSAAFDVVLDGFVAGWFALFIDEDRDRGLFKFEQWPIGQCYISASKPGGRIDKVKRLYKLTAEQAVSEFGEANVSDAIHTAAKEKPGEMFEFIRCIYPRSTYAVGAKMARNMPIASVTIERGSKKVVRESGYNEMPVIVPRLMKLPDSNYAHGFVYNALPNIKTLNELMRMELAAADLAVAGMWIAEDDGVLNPRTVKVGPRKVIVANSVDSMKPLLTGSDFKVSFTKSEQLQAAIRKSLMADQLQPQDGPAMTATEVHVRVGLIRQLMGPVYGRFQSEYLQPLIERCFMIAFRAGVFGEAPQSLQNKAFHVTYISPLARAQKLEEVSAIERGMVNAQAVAQVFPEALDLIDGDEAMRAIFDGLGVPNRIMRDADKTQALRDAKAQAQAQAQQQAQAQAGQVAMQEAMAQRMAKAA